MTAPVRIQTSPLTAEAFAPFGDVLEATGHPDTIINQGNCERFHDRARLDFGPDGRAGISLFRAGPRVLPLTIEMVERHPEGSQAFIPIGAAPFLVVAAEDRDGVPAPPRAFITSSGQGVNYHRGTWHGVLTPLTEPGLFVVPGLFAVVDRIGNTKNLEEYWYQTQYVVAF